MRRKEKEITDIREIEAIMQKAEVCRLGLAVDNTPYVVPVNYGYENHCLYIHCAKQGRKIDMIRQNNRVCFEMDIEAKIWDRDKPACDSSSSYRSVIGYGQAFLSEDFEEKKQALDIIMKHYSDRDSFQYLEEEVDNVGIIKIVIHQLSGKKSGDQSTF
jgi:nitroimidazol reductase NimA-like FMN-containing flavoprotein (pyridoxamine 5'-phosphate oxidase superfamily)